MEDLFKTLTYLWITTKTSRSSWRSKLRTKVKNNKKIIRTSLLLRLQHTRQPAMPVRRRRSLLRRQKHFRAYSLLILIKKGKIIFIDLVVLNSKTYLRKN